MVTQGTVMKPGTSESVAMWGLVSSKLNGLRYRCMIVVDAFCVFSLNAGIVNSDLRLSRKLDFCK